MKQLYAVVGLLMFLIGFSVSPEAQERFLTFSPIIKKVAPGVVSINTFTRDTSQAQHGIQNMLPPDSPLRKLFPKEKRQGDRDMKLLGEGSGFVIREDGYIVTNYHVIKGADRIEVIFSGNRKIPAKIMGYDEKIDIALLKCACDKPLPYVVFGDSEKVEVGDLVIGMGNPLGIGRSATMGIISAINRKPKGSLVSYLQTDASINKGNSGGPLFNVYGEVIGINTSIYTTTGGSVGIGFAIPSNIAQFVVDELIEYGRVRKGWLGITIDDVAENVLPSEDGDRSTGVLVASIQENSPAYEGGIRESDIITSFNGQKAKTVEYFTSIVAFTKVGSTVPVVVIRNGKTIELFIQIKER